MSATLEMPRLRVERGAPSTSIRVSTGTRDVLATEAASQHLSLSGYLDRLADKVLRQRALAELRDERVAAYQDPTFLAELKDWDAADDAPLFDDDGWPEFNG